MITVAAGSAMASSLMTLSFEINGKVARELRSFGANIVIEPRVEGLADIAGQKRYLRQEDIIKAKTIFWRHNIIGVAPFLEAGAEVRVGEKVIRADIVGAWYEKELSLPGEDKTFTAGTRSTLPWWNIDGRWPDTDRAVLVGSTLAAELGVRKGDSVSIDGRPFDVSGILETGGDEDRRVFTEMETLQKLKGTEGKISKVLVSALTTPMDEFAYKDPLKMSKLEYEKWYCTGYVTSIAKQLEEVFQGSRVKPLWQVAETEGKILKRLTVLIYILCIIALVSCALGVSATMIMGLLRRTGEIGLMKSIGADGMKITSIFISEGIIIGITGGLAGYLLSLLISPYIGLKVFNTTFEQRLILLPVTLAISLVISVSGTILPLKRALRIRPAVVLKGSE